MDEDTEVVGIDEGQFFDGDLPAVCNALANRGKRVIVAGLDQDYLGKPFEPMPQLLAIAEYITKTLAICMVCGNPANHTQRLVASQDRVLLGAQGTYEARCRACFDPHAGDPSNRPDRRDGAWPLPRLLLLFGVGFLVANARRPYFMSCGTWRGGAKALLLWPAPRPPFYGTAGRHRGRARPASSPTTSSSACPPPETLFGEGMMFLYYAYAVPMTARIERGFYRDGMWSDRGFVSYRWIGGLAWREGKSPVLLVAGRDRRTARPLTVPGAQYGAVRQPAARSDRRPHHPVVGARPRPRGQGRAGGRLRSGGLSGRRACRGAPRPRSSGHRAKPAGPAR